MALTYRTYRYGHRQQAADHPVLGDDAVRFLSEVAGLDADLVQGVKESRDRFSVACNGFKITIGPYRVGSWMYDNNVGGRTRDRGGRPPYNYGGGGELLKEFVDAAIELSNDNRTITIKDDDKPAIVVTEAHAKVTREGWRTKLHVKNQDGKWILDTSKYQYKEVNLVDMIEEKLRVGLANDRPLTKAEMLANGLPDPHTFDTDDRLTETYRGWIQIRARLLKRIKVDGIVTINQDRTVREAIDPSGQEAWFQINCETNIRHIMFVVLSNGEQYYIMNKIGSCYKVVESTQINSLVDASNMTKIDQTMIKEAMDSYIDGLQLQ